MPDLIPATVGTGGPGTPGESIHAGTLTLGDITLGAVDSLGVEWVLEVLEGWSDGAETVGEVVQRANDDGGWLNTAYYAPRVVHVGGALIANDYVSASQALDRLLLAVPKSQVAPMVVSEGPGRELQADVRQHEPVISERIGGFARFSLSLIAPDPRRYSSTLTSVSTGLRHETGGLTLPTTTGFAVTGSLDSGVLTTVNEGNMSTRPVLRVYGPAPVGTKVTHRNTGRALVLTEAVDAGRYLELDTDRKRALLDGTALRLVTGTWFEFGPGSNSVAFTAPDWNEYARLSIEFRSAWR